MLFRNISKGLGEYGSTPDALLLNVRQELAPMEAFLHAQTVKAREKQVDRS